MQAHLQQLLTQRYGRRQLLQWLAAGTVLAAAPSPARALTTAVKDRDWYAFAPLPAMNSKDLHVAKGFRSQVVVKWGDVIGNGLAFGYNNDFLAYRPLNGSNSHGLLCVNHEYPITELMFPGMQAGDAATQEQVAAEMASVGHSVLEIQQNLVGDWKVVSGSGYARRIDAMTPIELTGPAAGHLRLRTSDDPSGRRVLGTFANCSGGVTPWGTVLFAEENIDDFFLGQGTGEEMDNHERMGIGESEAFNWGDYHPRFRADREPREPNRFGWMVEIDPYQPSSTPKKRTALGRFKHEAAGCTLAPDGRVVVYLGDDEADEYLYRYVSRTAYQPGQPTEGLLDDGILSVARFEADGTLRWLPLIFGQNGLTPTAGFNDQGDVLIEARRAADVLGATPMDRPEDVQVNPVNGRVYVALTNNTGRTEPDPANPRQMNVHGHILELSPAAPEVGGHAGDRAQWGVFLLADGNNLSCPDNLAFDPAGNLWVATDGSGKTIRKCDGFFGIPTEGASRGKPKRLVSAPLGSEVCGPEFTPDGQTLFLCIQHPAEGSTYDQPSTRWPEFKANQPPKPSVVAIRRQI